MEKAIQYFFTIVMVLSLAYCTSSQKQDDKQTEVQVGEIEPVNSDEIENMLIQAMFNNRTQVALAKFSKGKTNDAAVEDFNRLLIDNYVDFREKLFKLAEAYGDDIPSTLMVQQKKEIEEIKTLNQDAFNAQYLDLIIKNHKENLKYFKRMLYGNHPDRILLKGVAEDIHDTLEKQLEQAKDIRKNLSENNSHS